MNPIDPRPFEIKCVECGNGVIRITPGMETYLPHTCFTSTKDVSCNCKKSDSPNPCPIHGTKEQWEEFDAEISVC